MTRVTFAHLHGDHRPGDSAEVDDNEARQLIHDGIAVAADESKPTATVDEILADVGDDQAKAAEALAAEQSRARPRTTLVEALTALASKEA